MIGGAGLTHALYSVGFTLTENNPDYVVVGETRSYDYEKIERAVRLILKGARFIATNPDLTGLPPNWASHPPTGPWSHRSSWPPGKNPTSWASPTR